MFYYINDQLSINLDQVVAMQTRREGTGWRREFRLTDGTRAEEFTASHPDQWSMPRTMIAAQPGYFCLQVDVEEGSPLVDREPVIGWSPDRSGLILEPVCLDCENASRDVLRPDGRVVCLEGSRTWPSEARWVEAKVAEEAARRARLKLVSG